MRLDEPQILIERPGDFVEQISGDLVIEIIGNLDRLARSLGGSRQRDGQRFEVLGAGVDVLGIRLEARARRNGSDRAAGRTAERGNALGQCIDVPLGVLGDLVEQLVQRDEVRALDVPVCLLRLQPKIDGVDESDGIAPASQTRRAPEECRRRRQTQPQVEFAQNASRAKPPVGRVDLRDDVGHRQLLAIARH